MLAIKNISSDALFLVLALKLLQYLDCKCLYTKEIQICWYILLGQPPSQPRSKVFSSPSETHSTAFRDASKTLAVQILSFNAMLNSICMQLSIRLVVTAITRTHGVAVRNDSQMLLGE